MVMSARLMSEAVVRCSVSHFSRRETDLFGNILPGIVDLFHGEDFQDRFVALLGDEIRHHDIARVVAVF